MLTFELGNLELTLAEAQSGLIAFGPQATNVVLKPLVSQALRKLKDKKKEDLSNPFQKAGGLFVDLDGSLSGWLVKEIEGADRLDDLVLVQLGGSERYNLINSEMSVAENALKLYQMVAALESGAVGLYRFVDVGFKLFLEELAVILSTVCAPVSLKHFGDTLVGDQLSIWMEEARRIAIDGLAAGTIQVRQYQSILDAVEAVGDAYFRAVTKAQVMTRHALSLVTGWIHQNPETQRLFCTDSTFSMQDVIAEGKLVVFNGSGIEADDARRIGILLAGDFQHFVSKRAKPAPEANTGRAAMLVCPQYDLIAPAGSAEGVDTRGIVKFWKEANLTRTMAFLGCSEYEGFRRAIHDPNFEAELRKAIRWWVILASESAAAAELVEFLALASVETKSSGFGGTFRSMLKGASNDFTASEFAKLASKARSANVPAAIYDGGFGRDPRPRCLRMNLGAK